MSMSKKIVKVKAWAYVENEKVWLNGVGNIAVYSRKQEAIDEATPNMRESGQLVQVTIVYELPKKRPAKQ